MVVARNVECVDASRSELSPSEIRLSVSALSTTEYSNPTTVGLGVIVEEGLNVGLFNFQPGMPTIVRRNEAWIICLLQEIQDVVYLFIGFESLEMLQRDWHFVVECGVPIVRIIKLFSRVIVKYYQSGIKHHQQIDFLTTCLKLLGDLESEISAEAISTQHVRALWLNLDHGLNMVRSHSLNVRDGLLPIVQPPRLKRVERLFSSHTAG